MDSSSEYEYEDDDNINEDEDYNYEEADDDEDEVPAPAPRHSNASNLGHGTNSADQDDHEDGELGPATSGLASFKKSPLDRNPLIRENSTSYELVVPVDAYLIRPLTDIAPLLNALVNEVANLLDICEDEAQGILQYFKWDKEKLTDSYFSNPDKVRLSCGLDLFSLDILSKLQTSVVAPTPGKLLKCRICYDEVEFADAFALGCAHYFCRSCFAEYLRNTIADGAACVSVHCPEHKCKQLVTKTIVHSLLEREESAKYDLYFIRDFIEKSKNMKYCPAARCEKVAVGSGITTVRCSCNHCFCFKCGEEAHDPSSCSQLSEWIEKCMNESETANWILANTRKCPQCTTRIEKNQGCNHMTCKICRHEFCWICMGEFLLLSRLYRLI